MVQALTGPVYSSGQKSWTAWRIWSKQIYDQIQVHIRSNHRMLSKLFISNLFWEKLNASAIQPETETGDDADNEDANLFLLSRVESLGDRSDDHKLHLGLREMKYAENAHSVRDTKWNLEVNKDLAQILKDVLKEDDYLIIWGGQIQPNTKRVVINDNNTSPCYIAIYRHDGTFSPVENTLGQFENPCCERNVSNVFFKGTAGHEVTIVQKIEPKTKDQITWTALETDFLVPVTSPSSAPSQLAGASKSPPQKAQAAASNSKQKAGKTPQPKLPFKRSKRQMGIKISNPGNTSPPIDLIELASEDSESKSSESATTHFCAERDQHPDIVMAQTNQIDPVESAGNGSVVSLSSSEEDFIHKPKNGNKKRSRKLSDSGSSSSPQVIEDGVEQGQEQMDQDEAHPVMDNQAPVDEIRTEEDEDEVEAPEPIADNPSLILNFEDALSSIGGIAVLHEIEVQEEGLDELASPRLNETEYASAEDTSLFSEVLDSAVTNLPLPDYDNNSESDELSQIEMEIANMSQREEISGYVKYPETIKELSLHISQTTKDSTNSTESHPSQLLSQDLMIEPGTQVFGEVEAPEVEQEQVHPPSPPPEDRLEKSVDLFESRNDSESSGSESDSDSNLAALIAKVEAKQLYDLKGVQVFHLMCKIHGVQSIPARDEVILRVSDGTHPPFPTRKGFPVPAAAGSQDDVMLSLQVDIMIRNASAIQEKLDEVMKHQGDDVMLGYVKIEKNRKKYLLTMDGMNSDISLFFPDITHQRNSTSGWRLFGEFIPQGEREQASPSKSKKDGGRDRPEAKGNGNTEAESDKYVENGAAEDGSSGESEPEEDSVDRQGEIAETPQVDAQAVPNVKRRLTFEKTGPMSKSHKEDLQIHALEKRYNLKPMDLKLYRLTKEELGKHSKPVGSLKSPRNSKAGPKSSKLKGTGSKGKTTKRKYRTTTVPLTGALRRDTHSSDEGTSEDPDWPEKTKTVHAVKSKKPVEPEVFDISTSDDEDVPPPPPKPQLKKRHLSPMPKKALKGQGKKGTGRQTLKIVVESSSEAESENPIEVPSPKKRRLSPRKPEKSPPKRRKPRARTASQKKK